MIGSTMPSPGSSARRKPEPKGCRRAVTSARLPRPEASLRRCCARPVCPHGDPGPDHRHWPCRHRRRDRRRRGGRRHGGRGGRTHAENRRCEGEPRRGRSRPTRCSRTSARVRPSSSRMASQPASACGRSNATSRQAGLTPSRRHAAGWSCREKWRDVLLAFDATGGPHGQARNECLLRPSWRCCAHLPRCLRARTAWTSVASC